MDIHERTMQLLVRTLSSSVEVLASVREPFLRRQLEDAICECLLVAVRSGQEPSVFARPALQLQRCLEDASLIDAAPIKSLLLAERHALLLLVHARSFPQAKSFRKLVPAHKVRQAPVHGNGTVRPSALTVNGLSDSMRAVLDGVGQVQPARAKDVISRCGSLSERTVKRNLKELVREGLVIRDTSDGSVRYRTTEAR